MEGRKEEASDGRTSGRASSRFTHHGHIHLFGWAGGRSFARGNGDGEKWEGRERREAGMKGNYFCMSLIQMSRSDGRPTRVGSALSGKKWNQSKDGIDLVF